MNYLLVRLIGLITMLVALVNTASAASPEETFKDAVAKMKASGSISALVSYVNWQAVYDEIPATERRALGYGSAEDLKNSYKNQAEANGEDQLNTFLKEVKKEGGSENTDSNAALVREELRQQQTELADRIAKTVYTIVAVRTDKGKATVTFTKSYKGKSTQAKLEMVAQGETWLIKSAAPLNPLFSSPMSPIGSLPQPTQVLFTP